MYLSILAFPLLGAMSAGFLGRKRGVTGAHIITCTLLVMSALLSMVAFYEVGLSGSPVSIYLTSWIDSESMLVNWGFLFDSLTVSMLLPVLVVSSLVHIFSVDYMAADPHNQRFFAYLSMFTFFMLILVAGDNYLIMFLGWEGIGVSSYLLINFWFTRIQANKSAIKALTVNRVGDMFLSVGFFALFWVFGNLDYRTVFSLSPFINQSALTVIGLLLLLAAMGKSAQLGLHTWLPDAMEGPTPVSALIHAATLVTAGVYLLLRSSPLLEYAPTTLVVITWVGALTAFFAATTGLLQNDIKRVIAYSTCSQMGYLFMAVGLSQYNVALFHLVNHAFFKRLLFLAAGGVLHSMQDQQDLRKLGGLISFLPFTYTAILVGSLSLMAFPFLTGFFSKDLILELAYGQYEFSGYRAYWLGTITAMITAFYSFRLISMTFLTHPNAPKGDYEHTHEQPLIVIIPYVILSLLAIFFGYLRKERFVSPGTDFLASALFVHPIHTTLVEAEFSLPLFYKLLPAVGSIFGAASALVLYNIYPSLTVTTSISRSLGANLLNLNKSNLESKSRSRREGDLKNSVLMSSLFKMKQTDKSGNSRWLKITSQSKRPMVQIYSFFNGKYYFDVIYNNYIINRALNLGLVTSKVLDRGLIETVGPFGLTNSFYSTSRQVATVDTGIITSYALYIILGFISLTLLLFATDLPGELYSSSSHSLGGMSEENGSGGLVGSVNQWRALLLFVTALVFNSRSLVMSR